MPNKHYLLQKSFLSVWKFPNKDEKLDTLDTIIMEDRNWTFQKYLLISTNQLLCCNIKKLWQTRVKMYRTNLSTNTQSVVEIVDLERGKYKKFARRRATQILLKCNHSNKQRQFKYLLLQDPQEVQKRSVWHQENHLHNIAKADLSICYVTPVEKSHHDILVILNNSWKRWAACSNGFWFIQEPRGISIIR